jgi:hypothetical protein
MTLPNTSPPTTAAARQAAIHVPVDYDDFVAGLGDRDRQNVERHVAFCYEEPSDAHARAWKRLALALARLAPRTAQTVGQRAVRFYVTDGKYRQQIFALEDLRDGTLAVYSGDVLADALRTGLIRGPVSKDESVERFDVGAEPGATLEIERLTTAKTSGAPEYYKHMLGWNRTALRIVLPAGASPSVMEAVEAICALSAAPRAARIV